MPLYFIGNALQRWKLQNYRSIFLAFGDSYQKLALYRLLVTEFKKKTIKILCITKVHVFMRAYFTS